MFSVNEEYLGETLMSRCENVLGLGQAGIVKSGFGFLRAIPNGL